MEFNPGKCQVIHITRSISPVKFSYFVHNQELESVDAAKYLGVTISKSLSLKTHINNITSNANKTLGFVKRNEPVHEIANNVVCATNKTSDQPAHMRSLIRAFAS